MYSIVREIVLSHVYCNCSYSVNDIVIAVGQVSTESSSRTTNRGDDTTSESTTDTTTSGAGSSSTVSRYSARAGAPPASITPPSDVKSPEGMVSCVLMCI